VRGRGSSGKGEGGKGEPVCYNILQSGGKKERVDLPGLGAWKKKKGISSPGNVPREQPAARNRDRSGLKDIQ